MAAGGADPGATTGMLTQDCTAASEAASAELEAALAADGQSVMKLTRTAVLRNPDGGREEARPPWFSGNLGYCAVFRDALGVFGATAVFFVRGIEQRLTVSQFSGCAAIVLPRVTVEPGLRDTRFALYRLGGDLQNVGRFLDR
jgi:hypothetical protein